MGIPMVFQPFIDTLRACYRVAFGCGLLVSSLHLLVVIVVAVVVVVVVVVVCRWLCFSLAASTEVPGTDDDDVLTSAQFP